MARICVMCGKRPQVGNHVSNANNKVKRWLYPNVQKMRFRKPGSAKVARGAVCTKCIKAGKIEKVM